MAKDFKYYQLESDDLDAITQAKSLFTYIDENIFGWPQMDFVRNLAGNKILMKVDEAATVPPALRSIMNKGKKLKDTKEISDHLISPEWKGTGDDKWSDDFVFQSTGKKKDQDTIGKGDWDVQKAKDFLTRKGVPQEIQDEIIDELQKRVEEIPDDVVVPPGGGEKP